MLEGKKLGCLWDEAARRRHQESPIDINPKTSLSSYVIVAIWGRGGGLVDRAADWGPYDPSSIPLGEKKENQRKSGRGWSIFKKVIVAMALCLWITWFDDQLENLVELESFLTTLAYSVAAA